MITVITGPPCSGKTSYVTKHKHAGDIVIDMDDLVHAFSGERYTVTYSDPVFHIAAAARTAAITAATKQPAATTWIIDTEPSSGRWHQYRLAAATIVQLTADRDELHARATAAGRPDTYHDLIDAWMDAHASRW
jgi:hypothetical protein